MSIVKKFAAAVTAVAICALGVAATAGTAQAAVEEFQLCNYGSNYIVRADFAGYSSAGILPGQCTTVPAANGSDFSLRVERLFSSVYFTTQLDDTYGSGRTLVQTWAGFDTFTYGKLPY